MADIVGPAELRGVRLRLDRVSFARSFGNNTYSMTWHGEKAPLRPLLHEASKIIVASGELGGTRRRLSFESGLGWEAECFINEAFDWRRRAKLNASNAGTPVMGTGPACQGQFHQGHQMIVLYLVKDRVLALVSRGVGG